MRRLSNFRKAEAEHATKISGHNYNSSIGSGFANVLPKNDDNNSNHEHHYDDNRRNYNNCHDIYHLRA